MGNHQEWSPSQGPRPYDRRYWSRYNLSAMPRDPDLWPNFSGTQFNCFLHHSLYMRNHYMLGYSEAGHGTQATLILNDWLGDTGSWDAARPYLDHAAFRWIWSDLRGYGKSLDLPGSYSAAEAAKDVIALADQLQVGQFSLITHSMSAMVALAIHLQQPDRISRTILVTPPPATGMQLPESARKGLIDLALGSDADRFAALRANWGDRLSEQWTAFKMERWRATAKPVAVAGYVDMFACTCPAPAPIHSPVLIVAGECDAPPMRSAALDQAYRSYCSDLRIHSFANCGHYPMQEMPVLLTTVVQRFLAGN